VPNEPDTHKANVTQVWKWKYVQILLYSPGCTQRDPIVRCWYRSHWSI